MVPETRSAGDTGPCHNCLLVFLRTTCEDLLLLLYRGSRGCHEEIRIQGYAGGSDGTTMTTAHERTEEQRPPYTAIINNT